MGSKVSANFSTYSRNEEVAFRSITGDDVEIPPLIPVCEARRRELAKYFIRRQGWLLQGPHHCRQFDADM